MSDQPKARLPNGFVDHPARIVSASQRIVMALIDAFELYGFEGVETPMIEYTEALGKFLPDQDRPNAGVFSFQDEDNSWLSLRYDLTAPLARHVAENFQHLAKPYRSYRAGWVFRNEKPSPGRFRQFMQVDADIVGAPGAVADAEIVMLAADCYQRLGFEPHEVVIKINNRKVLDGVLEVALGASSSDEAHKLIIMRAIDKLDRLGLAGVELLLGEGRMDASGDFTKGAGLDASARSVVLDYLSCSGQGWGDSLAAMEGVVKSSAVGREGVEELLAIQGFVDKSGYTEEEIAFDPAVVRGLEYYTGPVFEAQSITEGVGALGGGGRYDGLVARFRKEPVPATGFSVGVTRLLTVLMDRPSQETKNRGPVVITVMDREREVDYMALASQLRAAGIRAEVYVGASGMKAQLKYADRRKASLVIIQGSDEAERGTVMIKDLTLGSQMAASINSNEEWRASRPAQFEVPADDIVQQVLVRLAEDGDNNQW